jgi:hypothetical protein
MAESEDQQRAQALVNQLQAMKEEATAIAQKISELDNERHEHGLVGETLEKLDSSRKCFRLCPRVRLGCRSLSCGSATACYAHCARSSEVVCRVQSCRRARPGGGGGDGKLICFWGDTFLGLCHSHSASVYFK